MKKLEVAFVRFRDSAKHIYSICTIQNEKEYLVCGTYNTKNGVLKLKDIRTNPLTSIIFTLITNLLALEEQDFDKNWRFCVYY